MKYNELQRLSAEELELQNQAHRGVTPPMTNEEYARYNPWQQYPNQLRPMTADELAYQRRLQNQHSQAPPPGAGYVWQPNAMGGGQWVMPAPVRLSDEDVARIADAVVVRLRASPGALGEASE